MADFPTTDQALLQLLGSVGLAPNFNNLPPDVRNTQLPMDTESAFYSPTVPDGYPIPNIAQVADMLATGVSMQPLPAQPDITQALSPTNAGHEGANRVNQYTAETGIRAIVNDKGQVTLTNLTTDNQAIQKGAKSYDTDGNAIGLPTAEQTAVNNNVHGILSQMKEAKDADTLRGLQSQLNEAMAAERAKLMTQAQTHAATVLGIPEMETQLAYLQSLERKQPGWQAGMPELPQTTALRTKLNQTRTLVNGEAERYLSSNITANSLNAAAKSAEQEALRISRIADRVEIRREQKEEELKLKAQALTPQQKEVARVIFNKPDATDEELALTISATKDRATLDVLNADDGTLPLLASTGNTKASSLIEAKEAAVGIDPVITKARLKDLTMIMNTPALLRQGTLALTSGLPKEQQEQMVKDLQIKQTGLTAEDKKSANLYKYQAAKAMLSQGINATYRNHLDTQWAVSDPAFLQAVAKSKEVTGKADLPNVVAAYVGQSTGQELVAKLTQFKAIAVQAAKKTQGSQLGAIDPVMLANDIEAVGRKTTGQRIMQSLSNLMTVHPVVEGVNVTANAISNFWNSKE